MSIQRNLKRLFSFGISSIVTRSVLSRSENTNFSGFLSRNGWIWAAVIVLIVAALAASNRKTKIELKANKMPITDTEQKTQEQPNLQTDAEPKDVESELVDEPMVDLVSDHVRELELEMEQLRISLVKMQEAAADSH